MTSRVPLHVNVSWPLLMFVYYTLPSTYSILGQYIQTVLDDNDAIMGKPRLIVLVRHAQSEGNKNKSIHQIVPDHRVKLTDEGRLQVQNAFPIQPYKL
jgi:hypothetical protein